MLHNRAKITIDIHYQTLRIPYSVGNTSLIQKKTKKKKTIEKTGKNRVKTEIGRNPALFKVNKHDTKSTTMSSLLTLDILLFLFLTLNDVNFEVNNRNRKAMCEICSKLKIKTPEKSQ